MRKITLIATVHLLLACGVDPNAPATTSASVAPLLDLGEDVWVTLPSGSSNDLELTSGSHGWYTMVPNASGSRITGIETGSVPAGSAFYLRNGSTTVPIVLGHADSGSQWYNQFSLPYGQDFVLAPERGVWVEYWTHEGATVGWTVDAGPGMYGVTSTATPSHTLGSAWQNTTNRPVLGSYAVRIASTQSLIGGAAGRVELAIGSGSGSQPTVCGRVAGGNAGVTASGADTVEGSVSCMIPAGWWGILRSTNEVGTPTYTITTQLEQAL